MTFIQYCDGVLPLQPPNSRLQSGSCLAKALAVAPKSLLRQMLTTVLTEPEDLLMQTETSVLVTPKALLTQIAIAILAQTGCWRNQQTDVLLSSWGPEEHAPKPNIPICLSSDPINCEWAKSPLRSSAKQLAAQQDLPLLLRSCLLQRSLTPHKRLRATTDP